MQSNKQDALALKEVGNNLFKEKKYQEAIGCYTEAIAIDPINTIFYSNRSRCYKMLGKLQQGYEDALKATQLDQKNIKAHLLAGQILILIAQNERQANKVQTAIEKIKRSLSLCSSQGKKQFEPQLRQIIYRAKKILWNLKVDQGREKKKALRSYLINIVQNDENLSLEKKDRYNEKIFELIEENIRTQKQPPPSQLICFLSKRLMKDPICNQHGQTYCRSYYLQYLKTSNEDPKTRKSLVSNLIYPNINIRKAIEDYLQKNSWAYDQIMN